MSIAKRLGRLASTLFAVSFLTFLLLNLLPGDPVTAVVGPGATQEQLDEARIDLGLDRPLPTRYVAWVGDALEGDLGTSYVNRQPVTELLADRLVVSFQLMIYAQVLALIVAVPMGIAAAYKHGGTVDKSLSGLVFALLAMPGFIVGVLLVFVFSLKLNWFPAVGTTPLTENPLEHARSMFLPAATLACALVATYMRALRTDLVATLKSDFILSARAKGLSDRYILLHHALKASSFSLLTLIGLSVGQLIGGALVVEQIFGIAGVGDAVVRAIFQRDYLLVQGAVLIICTGYVIINAVVDISYAILDPRVRSV